MKLLQLLLVIGILWRGEAATITGNDYVLLVINKDVTCTAIVVQPGLAVTHAGCAKEGDPIKVCRKGSENGKDCDEGATIETERIVEEHPGVLIKLSDDSIQPVQINDKELAVGDSCSVIGFGHTQSGDAEKVSDLPQVFATTIKEIRKDAIELKAQAPVGICKGDEGGAVVCGNKLAGILPGKGSCFASTIKIIPISKIQPLIARQEEGGEVDATTTAAETTTAGSPYLGASLVVAVFPAAVLMLLFP